MFGIESLTGLTKALAVVGVVLIEALVLYVGYGGVTRLTAPRVRGILERE